MLRIAVNAMPLMAVHTGIARYLKTLHAHIEGQDGVEVVYITPGRVSAAPPMGATQGGGLDKLLSLHPKLVYLMRAAQWVTYEKYASYAAGRHEIDVFHESFYTPAKIGRVAGQVFTLHDLSLLLFPETHSLDRRMFFDRFFQNRLGQADHIIVPSAFVKGQLLEYGGFPAERVSVVHEGVDEQFYPRDPDVISEALDSHGLPKEYVLFVGTLEPRKNLSTLLLALSRCKSDVPLVIVGWSGWGDPCFEAELERLNLRHRVFFPGYVSDEALCAIYSGASAFLYPSIYEGFGLPVLEAMACGCPVLCSNAASIPEVAGESALYANPSEPEEWSGAIDSVVSDSELQKRLRSMGQEHAFNFSWQKAAAKTMAIFSQFR